MGNSGPFTPYTWYQMTLAAATRDRTAVVEPSVPATAGSDIRAALRQRASDDWQSSYSDWRRPRSASQSSSR